MYHTVKSAILSEIVPIVIVGALLALYAYRTVVPPVPDHLAQLVTVVVAFYFGAKALTGPNAKGGT